MKIHWDRCMLKCFEGPRCPWAAADAAASGGSQGQRSLLKPGCLCPASPLWLLQYGHLAPQICMAFKFSHERTSSTIAFPFRFPQRGNLVKLGQVTRLWSNHTLVVGSLDPASPGATRCPVACRYIAICHPMRAQTVCTVARAKRIIASVWGGTSIYCLLWLFLVDLNVSESQGLECGYKVSRSLYLPIYLVDFTVFFITPLLVATILYGFIGALLFRSSLSHLTHRGGSEAWLEARTMEGEPHRPGGAKGASCPRPKDFPPSRRQVIKV